MADDSRAQSPFSRANTGDFGSALRRFRLAAGLSQEELAERSGTGVNTISALERGARRAPYRSTVDALADALVLGAHQRDVLHAAAIRRRAPSGLTAVRAEPTADVPAAPANNLPRHLTSFIGREREIADIMSLVEAHRLVTLTGAGGVGKTRTALEAAADLTAEFRDGAWLIELGPLASADYVASTIVQTLGIAIGSSGEPIETIAEALRAKDALLVFDTCEHLIAAAARVILGILQSAPNVRILATSRQSLGIAGEATYRIPPLAVPNGPSSARMTAAEAAAYDGVALFVERAARSNDRFRLTDENAPAVVEICRRLDGIALGIELAASRTKSLSPRQIDERLDGRFRFLRAGRNDVVPRQQTLRALIDWSYDLLDAREQRVFGSLAIFVKSFPLEDAIAVATSDAVDDVDVVDILGSLVEKSLVNVEPAGDSVRYSLLDSNREYAWEKLHLAGTLDDVAGRQLRALRDRFAASYERLRRTGYQTEHFKLFADELENIRAALDRAQSESDLGDGARLLAEISGAWLVINRMSEGIERVQRFLDAIGTRDSYLRARLCITLTMLLMNGFVPGSAHDVAAEAVACARAGGDPETLAQALAMFAWTNINENRFNEAELALAEAERLPNISAHRQVFNLERRAQLAGRTGDMAAAARLNERLREAHAALGNAIGEQTTVINLAQVEFARGEPARAIALLRQILPATRVSGDKELRATVLGNLAGYLAAIDDLAPAVEAASEGIRVLVPGEPGHLCVTILIELLALVYALRGETARAATLGGYADAAIEGQGYQREQVEHATRKRTNVVLERMLTPHDLARLRAEGAALMPEMATAISLSPLKNRP